MNDLPILARAAQAPSPAAHLPAARLPTARLPAALQALQIGFRALVAGSRAIPMGDNGSLYRELAAQTGARESRENAS